MQASPTGRTPDGCVIRPIALDDGIVALWRDVYRAQHAPLLPVGVSIPFHPRGRAYGALIDDALAGFCCVDGNWLTELWVAVAWQRRGIGRALLGHAETLIGAAGEGEAFLTVLAINAPAITFYASHGWEREPGTLCSVTGQSFYRFKKRLDGSVRA